ncbi:hypothetical protein ACLM5H_08910 [Fredinandcohnia humi]
MAITSLLIFLIVIVGGIFLFVSMQKQFGQKGTKLVIGSYLVILVLSVIVYYILPDNFFIPETVSDSGNAKRYEEIYSAAIEGKIDQVDGVKQKENWNLSYQDSELNITSIRDSNMFTVFERKDSDDETLELIYYVSDTKYNGVDFFDRLSSPTVSLVEDRLLITNPKEFEISLAGFHKEFVISQFKGDGLYDEFKFDIIDRPSDYQIMYIRIPKSLTLTGMDYVNFVGEEN